MTNTYHPKNILVTGGAGFIGSNFIHYLLAQNPHVLMINLDSLTYAGSMQHLKNLPAPGRHHFIQGDVCDAPLVKDILENYEIDTVVHFAAESHVDRSINGPAQFIQTNIVGTFTLLEAARNLWLNQQSRHAQQCRFHHISTDEVYGSLELAESAFAESHAFAPNSPYSASKASSDHLVRAYYKTYGLPVTTSNCSNNYGPRQHQEKLIPTIINACLTNQPIPIYGDGKNIRDWLYVDDHCHGINTVLQQGRVGETYNIGGNCEMTNMELTRLICHLMDEIVSENAPHANLIQMVTDRKGHDFRYAINPQKIQQELGWSPVTPLKEGLSKTIESIIHLSSKQTIKL